MVFIICFFFIGAGYEIGSDVVPEGGHAWNAILYEGEYLLMDCTWGAGHVSNQQFVKAFNPFYFMCSPMKMIYRHFPTNSKHQYLQPIISKEEFINLPYVKSDYFKYGINLIKWPGRIAETSKDKISLEFEHTIFEEEKLGHYRADLEWKGQKESVCVQRLTCSGLNGGILHRILCNIPSNGDGILNLWYIPHGENKVYDKKELLD